MENSAATLFEASDTAYIVARTSIRSNYANPPLIRTPLRPEFIEMSKHTPDKRTRVQIACLNCRQRKSKCETNCAGHPCKRCSRRGLACECISIRDQYGHSISARTPAASGYDSLIYQPRSPALQAPAAASYSAVQAPASYSLQAGHAFPHSAQWEPTWGDSIPRATESGANFFNSLGGQPIHPEYQPYSVPAQGYSGSGYDSSHLLPYSEFAEPPHQIGPLTYPALWPSGCSQSQPRMHGCAIAVSLRQVSPGFMRRWADEVE
ncbi:hypothetical protein K438DRAFT_1975908 [Mycena galopus ATCC 62051]|nr:hypothetical protein K438DRAFT_1975908 [Mycena galopus ATCC 62051]